MDVSSVDYQDLGRWTANVPSQCAHPTAPHQLVEGYLLNGWVQCSCGGHRTVQCLAYSEDGHPCRAMHYLPRLSANCSLSPIPQQRRY
jgi:hypothetical protein